MVSLVWVYIVCVDDDFVLLCVYVVCCFFGCVGGVGFVVYVGYGVF